MNAAATADAAPTLSALVFCKHGIGEHKFPFLDSQLLVVRRAA